MCSLGTSNWTALPALRAAIWAGGEGGIPTRHPEGTGDWWDRWGGGDGRWGGTLGRDENHRVGYRYEKNVWMQGTRSPGIGDVQTTLRAEWDGIDLTAGTKIVKTTDIRISYRGYDYGVDSEMGTGRQKLCRRLKPRQ